MKRSKSEQIELLEHQIDSLKKDLVHVEFHRNLLVRQIEQRDAELKVLREEVERWAELVRTLLFSESLDEEPRTERTH